MRIGFFSPQWPVEATHNGIVTYVDSITRALESMGHECVVITSTDLTEDGESRAIELAPAQSSFASKFIDKMPIGADRHFERKAAQFAGRIAAASKTAKATGPIDIFEIEESFGRSRALAKMLGAPVAVRLHGPHFLGKVDEMGPEDHIRIKAEGVAIREAEAITSPSPGLLEETKTYYGGAGAAHRAIPNPVEFPSDTDLWRFEACDPHLVLFVGRFDLRKGADVTLAAFAMVAEKNPRARLVMAGPDRGIVGDDGALIHFPEYAQANLSEDVRDRVEFLGSVPYESLLELRRRACVYVSTSRFECCAYAAMEALAAACPVILSETFGPPELLNLGKDILTAPIGDAAGIAKHIESVLGDPERAQALSAAGRAAAERHFAPEIVAGQLAAFYKEVLAARS